MTENNGATRRVALMAGLGMAVRMGSQAMTLVLLLLAGRFLTVELFGTFVLASILMNFSLMQMYTGVYHYVLKQPEFEQSKGTAFSLQVVFAVLFFALIAAAAGLVFLLGLDRLLGWLILATAPLPLIILFSSWQEAVLLREGRVNFYYLSMLLSEVSGFAVGVAMLVSGGGVWSLIVSRYVSATMLTTMLSVRAGRLPKPEFDLPTAISIVRFGAGLYGNSALSFFSAYGAAMVIGGFLSTRAVGLFRMGARTATAAFDVFAQTTRILTWQAVGRMARENRLTSEIWLRLYATVLIVMISSLGTLSVLGRNLTLVILGEEWLEMVPVLQIICFVRIVASFELVASAQLAAIGQTAFLFRMRMVEAAILSASLLIAVQFGAVAVAYGLFPSAIVYAGLLFWRVSKATDTRMAQVIEELWPALAIGLSAILAAFIADQLLQDEHAILHLGVGVLSAIAAAGFMAVVPLRDWTMRTLQSLSVAILPAAEPDEERVASF